MKYELFIAKRIHFSKVDGKKVSRPAVRIAIGGIALGLAVMILAVAIVIGFKQEVRNKLIGFGSHIQIGATFNNQTYETMPIMVDASMLNVISAAEGIKHVQRFATQPGIINTNGNFQGVVLKGVDGDFDWNFFKSNLRDGEVLSVTDSTVNKNVIISQKLSDLLKLKVGDKFLSYFIIDGKVRVRPLVVQGVYSTGFGDYDKLFVLCDIKMIQRLNSWEEGQCSGVEVLIDDYDNLDAAYERVFRIVGNRFDEAGSSYVLRTIRQINPQIFSWLDLLDINVVIILILMSLVAGFTMISGLLILILERTNMIGVLKALGASNWSIRKIFLYQSLFLVGKGMLIGNLIGITICAVQSTFGLLHLDPDVYYVDMVPMHLTLVNWLFTNILTFVVLMLMIVGPSYIITKISPAKSIRFE
ncbi:MAG: FtsX-like permease family protein [Paludibacteraceae bacterium]|nr:ABC transporter permease [Prevotellaceae bacterium]